MQLRIELTNKGDFKTLLNQLFKVWNNLITIAETTPTDQDPTPLFAKELNALEEASLPFLQSLLKGDDKEVLPQACGWLASFFNVNQTT